MRNFKLFLMLLSALVICLSINPAPAKAQQKRALLIGINTYAPDEKTAKEKGSEWNNLKGTVNDVNSIQSILMSSRFGFHREDIVVLKESQATREGILNAISDLINHCKSGDLVLIYYSGHGDQVKNSASVETDYLDEGSGYDFDIDM